MCFAARDTLFANALFGTLIRSVNAIPLKRGRSDIAAIKAIIERLNDGLPVCLYPEGTRTADGRINAIKPGVALLSRRAGVPVVPMIIDGAFEAWPRTRKLFRAGCRVVVCYGPPIPASTVRQMGDDEFARHLTDLMRNMQNQVRAQLGRSPIGYPAEADSASGGPA
jgi:1-acyl-sn-glycerol-3-phosphate acyltransferase